MQHYSQKECSVRVGVRTLHSIIKIIVSFSKSIYIYIHKTQADRTPIFQKTHKRTQNHHKSTQINTHTRNILTISKKTKQKTVKFIKIRGKIQEQAKTIPIKINFF